MEFQVEKNNVKSTEASPPIEGECKDLKWVKSWTCPSCKQTHKAGYWTIQLKSALDVVRFVDKYCKGTGAIEHRGDISVIVTL